MLFQQDEKVDTMDYGIVVSQARIADAQEWFADESISWGFLEYLPIFQAWLRLIENQDNN